MIPNRRSQAEQPNPRVVEARRSRAREGNRDWVARQARADAARDPRGCILLLGGTGQVDFRLRVAQSHARQDMLPSMWSHVALLGGAVGKGARADQLLYEVSLEPAGGFGAVPQNNGVQEGLLSRYDDPARYPNVALLRFLEPDAEALEEAVVGFRRDRRLVDVAGLIVEWLAFAWGAGSSGNPLLREAGLPGAAFVEGVYAHLGVDLTPGSSTRASSPEAIWQAARWWHEFYGAVPGPARAGGEGPSGRYCTDQQAASCTTG